MTERIRIGAVSYLNTRPLVFGLEQGLAEERIDLSYDATERQTVLRRLEETRPDRLAGLAVTGRLTIDGFRFDLADGGWLIIRFSGTEPLLRVYCETTHGDRVQDLLNAGRELAGI